MRLTVQSDTGAPLGIVEATGVRYRNGRGSMASSVPAITAVLGNGFGEYAYRFVLPDGKTLTGCRLEGGDPFGGPVEFSYSGEEG